MATTVADVVRKNPAKRGLAIIVTNDYSSLPNKTRLNGPRRDGERMQRVFTELGIATLWKHNIGEAELVRTLREVARLPMCPASYKSISFVFSGHGEETGEVYMQDGNRIGVQEIVNFLIPQQAPNIGNIPKIFFIDACRGSKEMQAVVCPRGEGGTPAEPVLEVHRRGATDNTILVPPSGNILVAYSTTSSHRALENSDGGVWMKALAEKLRSSKETIETVLTEVRRELHVHYQNPGWRDNMQLPETINTLLKPVYFHPTAEVKMPDVPAPALAPDPGEFTQRNTNHPGHYRGRLLTLEQSGVIASVKDAWRNESTGFICTITFIHAATRRQLQFQSERIMPSKGDARESAAKVAVLSLDIESNSSTAMPGPRKAATSPKTSTKPSTKDPISKLKEYCELKKIKQPIYKEEPCGAQQFKCCVTVQGKMFQGTVQGSKKEAKKAAAQKAINGLALK